MGKIRRRSGRFPESRFIANMAKTDQDQVNYLKLAMGITTNQVLFQVMLTSMMMAAAKLTEPSKSEETTPSTPPTQSSGASNEQA